MLFNKFLIYCPARESFLSLHLNSQKQWCKLQIILLSIVLLLICNHVIGTSPTILLMITCIIKFVLLIQQCLFKKALTSAASKVQLIGCHSTCQASNLDVPWAGLKASNLFAIYVTITENDWSFMRISCLPNGTNHGCIFMNCMMTKDGIGLAGGFDNMESGILLAICRL